MVAVSSRALDGRGLAYREFVPEPALAADIEYLWTMTAAKPLAVPVAQTSASKSTLDLIVPLDGNFCAHAEHHLFGSSARGAYLVGTLSQPRTIVTAGRCTAVGARFRPGRAVAFFGVPMAELSDRVLALDAISGILGRRMFAGACAAHSAGGPAPIQRVLRDLRTPRRSQPGNAAMAEVIRLIDEHHGNVAVAALARATGSSIRQLERNFRATVGLAPKLACQIARVRHAMSFLPLGPGATLAEVAQACGYYDQAHFVREFRAVAGVTPGAFVPGCGASITQEAASMSYSYKTECSPSASLRCHGTDLR